MVRHLPVPQAVQALPPPPPPPVQQATPFTLALQVPPLLHEYGDWHVMQLPSEPVQPALQLFAAGKQP